MTAMEDNRRDLVIRTVVAVVSGGAGLAGPDVAAALTGLAPVMEAGLSRVYESLSAGRRERAADALQDAATAAGAKTNEEFLAFVEQALSDPERQELLARVLLIAQDTAMRDKRRALGRALTSAVADNGTLVDEELIFIRVVDDLDPFHIRLMRLMTGKPARVGDLPVRPWLVSEACAADPGLASVAYSLMSTLERHGLVWSTNMEDPEYTLTQYGEHFLSRLADEPASNRLL